MTQSASPDIETKSPLNAAQKIVAELQGMNKDDQSLALHFAMQTLRLASTAPHAPGVLGHVQPHSPQMPAAPSRSSQPTDIKAFTAAKSPKSDQQFAAVVAYFYQFEAPEGDRKDVIDPETMKEAARLAGRPQVKRWAMTLANAKNAGYLNPAGHGKFKLNAVGENLVAITLPGNGATGGGNGSGTRKQGAKKKVAKKKRSAKKLG